MTATARYQLRYRLKLDAPALLTTLSGDPNTVEGERSIPGSSLLGAVAGGWIRHHHLGTVAHADPDFARLFLRGGLTFLNAYPEDPRSAGQRLLPVPLSFRRSKRDGTQVYDEAVERVKEADTRVGGFARLLNDDAPGIVTAEPATRLRLHTARADRLLGRATEEAGALFAYEALDGGQTFLGSLLGSRDDLLALQRDLGWNATTPFTCSLGRSRSAEYGGQARLTLLADAPLPFVAEAPFDQRQDTEERLVLTLTAHLLPTVGPGSDARLRFPFEALADALTAAKLPVGAATLAQGCRAFTQPVLIGGYSGIWGMPRPQLAGFAAGSVFCFSDLPRQPDAADYPAVEQDALGQRTAEGFGRFVLNWHGEHDRYAVRTDRQAVRPPKPASPPPATFQHVALDVARTWARERTLAAAFSFAEECRPRPSPSLLRRIGSLLSVLDVETAPLLREQLQGLAGPARQQLHKAMVNGHSLWYWLDILCSPADPTGASMRRALFRLQDVPRELSAILADIDAALEAPEQQAALANLFIQAACAELARLQRGPKGASD